MSTIRFVLTALALVSTTAACSADPSSSEGETDSARDALGSGTPDVVSPRDPASGQAAPSTGKGASADPSTPPASGGPSTGRPSSDDPGTCVPVAPCPSGTTWSFATCACVPANPSTQPCVEIKLCPLGQTWDVKACACVGPTSGGPSAGSPKGPSAP